MSFYVQSNTGKRHEVAGRMEDVPRLSAFRDPLPTACGQSVVPVNYWETWHPRERWNCAHCQRQNRNA